MQPGHSEQRRKLWEYGWLCRKGKTAATESGPFLLCDLCSLLVCVVQRSQLVETLSLAGFPVPDVLRLQRKLSVQPHYGPRNTL